MPAAWFLMPYSLDTTEGIPVRRIDLDGWPGIERWSEVEVLGNQAAVKVRAPAATLDELGAQFTRFDDIDTAIPPDDRDRLRQIGLDAGYTLEQVESVDAGITTYRDFLAALATYRTQVRRGGAAEAVLVPVGAVPAAKSIATLDGEL